MSLIKFNRRNLSNMFDEDFFPSVINAFDSNYGVDIYETEEAVCVEAQVPGMSEEDIKVTIEGSVLTIEAQKEVESSDKNKIAVYQESKQTSFRYSTSLPRMVDSSKAEAEVENGIVTITMPKMESEKAKRINVKKK
jgi:HSP20 family protein